MTLSNPVLIISLLVYRIKSSVSSAALLDLYKLLQMDVGPKDPASESQSANNVATKVHEEKKLALNPLQKHFEVSTGL